MAKNVNIDQIASDTAASLVDDLTAQLRNLANAADWPQDIIRMLSVEWDGRNLSVVYPSEYAQQIENLEYGEGSDKPNTVIRAFVYRCIPTVKNVLANVTMPQLMDVEEMFA